MTNEQQWFEGWFDSKYYHILYKNRNEEEASFFLDNLLEHLKPTQNSLILDLACGKGRHSRYLAEKGFEVTGVDLSVESIKAARAFETRNLSFFTHDMREYFRTNYFDYILNLFTSFGYFDTLYEHQKTINNIAKGIRPNGYFVLDFFNSNKVIANLVPEEKKTIDNIEFNITRSNTDGKIIKNIEFTDQGKAFRFQEKVSSFFLADFEKMIEKAGLTLVNHFGGYDFQTYEPSSSPRLILIAQKHA